MLFRIRSLAGKYVLKAKNKHGEDSAEVQIDVFGKPTAPTGPLNVRPCHTYFFFFNILPVIIQYYDII